MIESAFVVVQTQLKITPDLPAILLPEIAKEIKEATGQGESSHF